jgi:hypothetical protein
LTPLVTTLNRRQGWSTAAGARYTSPRVIPSSFKTLRALRVLNIGAVGLALAGVVGAVMGLAFHGSGGHLGLDLSGVETAPTLLCGVVWAWLLRRPATVGKTSIRWGWVASIPLAMSNAGLTLAVMLTHLERMDLGKFLASFLLGATLGAMVWIPALLATLVCFGLPIASAQRLAKKGLAGEERGELIVGLVCAVMSLFGVAISFAGAEESGLDASVGMAIPRLIALVGLIAGLLTTGLATARAARRRAFVAEAEAGKVPNYRIDATDEGKVLIRIVAQGKGYRVADFEEEVFDLDAAGEAKRPKHAEHRPVG